MAVLSTEYELAPDFMFSQSVILDTSTELLTLATRVDELKKETEDLYKDIGVALASSAGAALSDILIKQITEPLDNLSLIYRHLSAVLISVEEKYHNVANSYPPLNESIVRDDEAGGINISK